MDPTSEAAKRRARVVPGFGKRLQSMMHKHHLSLEDLAHHTCLSSSTLARALNDDRLSRRTEERIAAVAARLRASRQARRQRRSADEG